MRPAAARAFAAVVVAFLAIALVPATARGYVRQLTSRGHPVSWRGACIFMTPHADGSSDISDGSEFRALTGAAEAWNNVGCSYVSFFIQAPTPTARPGFDREGPNTNVVVYVESGWAHDPDAAAITSLTWLASDDRDRDGNVVDGDVEVNGQFFSFATDGDPLRHDIQNVLTHELGHVLGLDHTCDDGAVLDPRDHFGSPLPSCNPELDLPPEIREATMYNFALEGETNKRTLSDDDVLGVCTVYPLAEDPGTCAPIDLSKKGCGKCGAAGPAGGGEALLLLLVVGLFLGRRRRRRR